MHAARSGEGKRFRGRIRKRLPTKGEGKRRKGCGINPFWVQINLKNELRYPPNHALLAKHALRTLPP